MFAAVFGATPWTSTFNIYLMRGLTMKKVALLVAMLATVSVGACASYHQSYKQGTATGKDEAAARAAKYGSAEKTAKVK